MKTSNRLLLTGLLASRLCVASDVPPPAVQIASAILAAPEELRAGAAVLGYDAQGALVKLREGKNELICLASDPSKKPLSVACYQDRKSTRLNSSHSRASRMPSSA